MRITFKASLLAAIGLAVLPAAAFAQFTDTFDTINPAWVVNRAAPAGFASVSFDGDNRLQLTIDHAQYNTNTFYDTQGMERPGGITGLWTLSAQLYASSTFNDPASPLASSDLWAHTGTTDASGDYATFGFSNEPDPTRAFRLLIFTGSTGYEYLNVPDGFQFDAWHLLSITSTGTHFVFSIDGTAILTADTSDGNDLLSAMIQGYNFGQAGSYSVDWDNVTASAIPEPAATAELIAGLFGLIVGVRKIRRHSALRRID